MPASWLDAHPEVDAPNARETTTLTPATTDQQFDQIVDNLVAAVEHHLAAAG